MHLMDSWQPFARQDDYPTRESFLAAVNTEDGASYRLEDIREVWLAWRIGWGEDYPKGAYTVEPINRKRPRGATNGWIMGDLP